MCVISVINFKLCALHEKKEIIAACLHLKLKLTGNKKSIAASYLEDLLGIRSSKIFPNNK